MALLKLVSTEIKLHEVFNSHKSTLIKISHLDSSRQVKRAAVSGRSCSQSGY